MYQHLVFHWRHSAWVIGLIIVAFNAAMFFATDTLNADFQAIGFSSREQLVGTMLLMTLMPSWLFASFIIVQRRTIVLANNIDLQIPAELQLSTQVTTLPRRQIVWGAGGGFIFSLVFNVPDGLVGEVLAGNWSYLSVFFGQIAVWVSVGCVLSIRLYIANLFFRLGNDLEFSIFEQSRLKPFARVGMLDVVIVVGGMVITTVQSIDAQFRLENYLTAYLVAIPAATALLIRPMWTLHVRMAQRKSRLLQEVRDQLEGAPEDSQVQNMERMEFLLQRRDRVRALHTWPLDLTILSRLFFYVLIPPLAWSGAALVEVAIDRLLGL